MKRRHNRLVPYYAMPDTSDGLPPPDPPRWSRRIFVAVLAVASLVCVVRGVYVLMYYWSSIQAS